MQVVARGLAISLILLAARGIAEEARPPLGAPLAPTSPTTPPPPEAERDAPAAVASCPRVSSDERELRLDPGKQSPLHIGLKTYPQTFALADKEVILSFDDGPDPQTTPQVLAALKQACVHAMFFLIGRHAAKYPELARRELYQHHTVGHHSNTHPSFTLRGFDTRSAERDIEDGIAADDAAIYPNADDKAAEPRVPFFRFPGFADTPELLEYLDRRHIAVFGTDLWAADWLRMTPEHERQRVLDLLRDSRHHNGIILFHDTRRSTAAMLPALLADLKREGYTFVIPRYVIGAPPVPLTKPQSGWTSETQRIIAHLRVPITPGSHSLGDTLEPAPGDDRPTEDRPRDEGRDERFSEDRAGRARDRDTRPSGPPPSPPRDHLKAPAR